MASATTIKTIVITGSSGYVGQHLIAHLARHGLNDNDPSNVRYKVYCAYNSLPTFPSDLSEFCQNSIDAMHPSIISMEAFVLDFQSDDNVACTIRRACGDATVDVILHLAALSSPYYCQFHPEEAWRINVPIGLLKINADIVYMSTDQVYEGTDMFYSEDEKTLPVNLYGRTKLAFERVLFMSNRISGGNDDGLPPPPLLTPQELGDSILPDYLSPQQLIQHYPTKTTKTKSSYVILRSSLILGAPPPFTHGCKKGSSFLQFVQQRLTSCTSTDYYVNEYRSMVHVRDVITALIHFTRQALECHIDNDHDDDNNDDNGQGVRIYNLGGRERVNRYELAVAVAKHLKLDYTHCVHGVERPKEENDGGVPSPPDISMNVDKLTKELGVEKLDGLDEIIQNTF